MNKKANILIVFLSVILSFYIIVPSLGLTGGEQVDYIDIDTSIDVPVEVVDKNGKFPQFTDGISVLIAASKLFGTIKNYELSTSGEICVRTYNIRQQVSTHIIVDDNEVVTSEDVTKSSNSMSPSISHYVIYNRKDDTLKFRETNNVDDSLKATYTNPFQEISKIDYANKYGIVPMESDPYVISPQSVVNERNFVHDENGYSFTINFKPAIAGKNYKSKIREMSGTGNNPAFQKMQYVVKIDNNGKFISLVQNETYSIQYNSLISVTIDSTTTRSFVYHDSAIYNEIPSGF